MDQSTKESKLQEWRYQAMQIVKEAGNTPLALEIAIDFYDANNEVCEKEGIRNSWTHMRSWLEANMPLLMSKKIKRNKGITK